MTHTLAILSALFIFSFAVAVGTWRIKRRGGSGRSFNYGILLLTVFFSAFLVYGANSFLARNTQPLPKEELTAGNKRLRPDLMYISYTALAEQEPENLSYHFNSIYYYHRYYTDSLFDNDPKEDAFIGLLVKYNRLATSGNPAIADAGIFGQGILYYYMGQYADAVTVLERLQDKGYPYVNEYIGKASKAQGLYSKAEIYFSREIDAGGDVKRAYEELGYYWFEKKRFDKLEMLLDTIPQRQWVPIKVRKEAYLHTMKVGAYFSALVAYTFSQPGYFQYIAALMILLVWLVYLLKVNIYHRGISNVIFMLAGGAFSAFIAIFLYDVVGALTGLRLNQRLSNDLLYSIGVVGGVEELVKLIPFLLLLLFTNKVQEPIDYLVYASVAAIGFAFTENLLYFSQNAPAVVSMRALLTTIGHMFGTTMVAYGLVLAKFRHRKQPYLYIFGFYLLAAIVHGLYDFFLLSKNGLNIPLLSIILWMGSLYVFTSFINNALNNSSWFEGKSRFDPSGISLFLTTSLLAVFVMEYLRNCFIYGPVITNSLFLPAVSFIIVLLLFMSRLLGDLDIMQNEWQPIRFFSVRRSRNYNKAIGMRVQLSPRRAEGIDNNLDLTVSGTLLKRIRIGRSNNYYMVALDEPLEVDGQLYEQIYIRSKAQAMLLVNNADIEVFILIKPAGNDEDAPAAPGKREDYQFFDTVVLN